MWYFDPTPNKELKKLLDKNFTTYEVDEYNTSKMSYETGEVCGNLLVKDKDGKRRAKHAILTYYNENKTGMCLVNRDKNACRNMKKIVDAHYKGDKDRKD